MGEYVICPQDDFSNQSVLPLQIPWLKRWDLKTERKTDVIESDHQTRLFNIDYMNMLEELEFK